MGFGSAGSTSQIEENFWLQAGVDISNNSWGFGGFFFDDFSSPEFQGTAAAIEKMDLMITTDTAVVHIAASLGKPVWNLLSREGYWLYGEGDTTPWYPSIRLFRQKVQSNWVELFGRVEAALRAHLEDRKP